MVPEKFIVLISNSFVLGIIENDSVSKTDGTHEKTVIRMLVINPGIQKNKGKVKKGLRQTELHSMSLWLLLRGAVHPESLPAGQKWKSNH